MKVLEPGVAYNIENFQDSSTSQTIRFFTKIKKEDVGVFGIETIEGSTNEELIKVLLHRLEFLNTRGYSKENEYAIKALHESLFWLGQRNKRIGQSRNENKKK